MTWRVTWERRAANELRRLARRDPDMARRIGQAVTRLAETGQGDVKRLEGRLNEWRLRVGDWRVRFERFPQERILFVLRVAPRKDAYRR